MYISKIELNNIRSFKRIVVDLGTESIPKPWTLILGDNGTGKSTFLRSVALGLSSPNLAGALFEDARGNWLSEGANEGSIRIMLDSEESIEVKIKLERFGESIVTQDVYPDESVWNNIFICGYGAARSTFGTKSYEKYSARDSVSSLFNYDAPLQNPELVLYRLGNTSNISEMLFWIDEIFMLPRGSTRLGIAGLEIQGPWGGFTPIGSLGDGYQATLAWILDMLGWFFFKRLEQIDIEQDLKGIVLIDEIEQHLHPIWQKRIIGVLHRQFPKIQFISTTHSPLCAIGTTELEDKDISLILLRRIEQSVQAIDELKPPRGLRADQVLTSYLFGLDTTSDDQTKMEIEQLSRLLSFQSSKSSENVNRINSLRNSLRNKLGTEETDLERRVSYAIQEVLSREPDIEAYSPEAINYEVRRQLKELFDIHD